MKYADEMAPGIHTKFLDDRFRDSGKIKRITSTMSEAITSVLQTKGSCDEPH
jgi:hypothetical protein